MKQLISIQYLRGIAAVMVVLHHILEAHPSQPHWISIGAFNRGAFGVDIFFVISGFIMWTSAKSRPYGPIIFILRRIVRVIPLYWAITLVTAFASNPFNPSFSMPEIEPLLRSLFLIPQWSQEFEGVIIPIVKVGWTIELEMFFYLLFAFLLLLQSNLRLWVGCGVFVILALVGAMDGPFSLAPLELYTQSVIIEFAYGLVLGAIYSHFERKYFSSPEIEQASVNEPSFILKAGLPSQFYPILGLLLVLIGFTLTSEDGKYSAIRGLVWGLPALMIVAGALLVETKLQKYPISFLKAIGDSSYSLYLFHLLVLAITERTLGVWLAPTCPWLAMVSQTLVCILIAHAIYLALEKPVTRTLNRWVRSFAVPFVRDKLK